MIRWLGLVVACSSLFGLQMEGEGWIGGFRRGAGVQGWTPVIQRDSGLLFAQAAGGYFIDSWQGSLGLGYRNVRGFGVNLFGDVSRRHVQLGAGAELFGRCWNVTLNGYLPNRHLRVVGSHQQGNWIYDELEQGYAGTDLVGGYSVSMGPGELWGYAGYFYYDARQVKSLHGPRLRVEYKVPNLCWGIQAHAGVEWQYDRLHKSDTSFIVGIQVPLGRKKRCCRPSPMCELVRRQRGIWVLRDHKKYGIAVENPLTLLFVAHNAMGVGTRDDPMHINAAVEMATPSHMIMLVEPVELKETLKLRPGQKLGSSILHGGDFDLIELSNNNTIANMELRGGLNAIVGRNITGLSLQNVTIKNAKAAALSLDGVDDVKIAGLEIHDSPMGIDIKNAKGKPITLKRASVLGKCHQAILFKDNEARIGVDGLKVAGDICNITINRQKGALKITRGQVATKNGSFVLANTNVDTVSFDQFTMSGTQCGIALDSIDGGNIALDQFTITDSYAPIKINGGSPTITISNAAMSNIPLAFKVRQGSPTLTYIGTIDNAGSINEAPLLDISGTVGGKITLRGEHSWQAGYSPAISLSMAKIDLDIEGASLQSTSNTIYNSHTEGMHAFTGLQLEGGSVEVDQHFGFIALLGIHIKNSDAGIHLKDIKGDAVVNGITCENVKRHYVHVENSAGNSMKTFAMSDCKTIGSSSSRAASYRFDNQGSGAEMNIIKLDANRSNRMSKRSGFFFVNGSESKMIVPPDGTLKGVDKSNDMPALATKSGTIVSPKK